jgi:tRNA (cytidine/uridine-2'-O-)-methyltransferase
MFNIALYQPDIPQNTAAIIRLCSCFNVTLEIIEPCGFNLNDKRLKRVAMDYLDKKKINIYESYDSFLKKKKNSRVILMTTKTKNNCFNFKFIPKDTLLFGRESAGVPKIVHKNSHVRLKIPLTKKSRSLNISIAAAITLSEALKQNFFFQND